MLYTKVDGLVFLVQRKHKASLRFLANKLGWPVSVVEQVARVLESEGIVSLHYPVTLIQSPNVVFRKAITTPELTEPKLRTRVLETYKMSVDQVPADVTIAEVEGEPRPLYRVVIPEVGPYTKIFFEHLKDEIAREIPIEVGEITDVVRSRALKRRFYETALKHVRERLPEMGEETDELLAGIMLHAMYGLGNIEILMADDWIEEVTVNGSRQPISIYHRKYGWLKTNLVLETEQEIFDYASQVGRRVGEQINLLHPILDAHLVTGDRVNATLFPISAAGNTITIRRFARNPWTITQFCSKELNTMSKEMAALLWMSVQYELNIMVAGGTASGKTSALNTLCALLPPYHRLLSIEDTRELALPSYLNWNWVPMTTRGPSEEGVGEVTMLDLLISALHMRPDRIIFGEIRKKREAETLFEAMHTGHSTYTTMHADTAQQVMRRLMEAPMEIAPVELESLHMVVVQYRDRRTNLRRTFEICEVVPGAEARPVDLSCIYRWRARKDAFEQINGPARIYDELNTHTGMTIKEIEADLADRKKILSWMVGRKTFSVEDVGTVMKAYYSDADRVLKVAEKGWPITKLA